MNSDLPKQGIQLGRCSCGLTVGCTFDEDGNADALVHGEPMCAAFSEVEDFKDGAEYLRTHVTNPRGTS